MQKEVACLKEAKATLKSQVAELKARPARKPLETAPEHEAALKAALANLAQNSPWGERVRGWPAMAAHVGTAVSESDIMLVKSHARAYAEVGLSAVACVQAGLTAAGKADPRRILDFGCGFGRVLRFLRAAYPAAEVFCTDMDAEGLGFCTHHFNTFGMRTDLERGPEWVAARFDLIWVGSVFTHLDVPNCQRLLRHLAAFLAPGGLVAFTTHGDRAQSKMKAENPIYGLKPEVLRNILADCASTGHGYADYPTWPGYGVSAMTTAWVDSLITTSQLVKRLHLPAGWANHQDVFVAERL